MRVMTPNACPRGHAQRATPFVFKDTTSRNRSGVRPSLIAQSPKTRTGSRTKRPDALDSGPMDHCTAAEPYSCITHGRHRWRHTAWWCTAAAGTWCIEPRSTDTRTLCRPAAARPWGATNQARVCGGGGHRDARCVNTHMHVHRRRHDGLICAHLPFSPRMAGNC